MKTLVRRLGAICLLFPGRYEHVRPGRRLEVRLQGSRWRRLRLGIRHLRQRPSQQTCPVSRHNDSLSPPQRGIRRQPSPQGRPPSSATANASDMAVTPSPLRTQARIPRLWIKPWEDADGDLYDQGYVYAQVDNGQWQIDHVQRQIRHLYVPAKPRLSRRLRQPPNSAPVYPVAPTDGCAPAAVRGRHQPCAVRSR